MIVYQGTKEDFTNDVINNEIEVRILQSFQSNLGRTTSDTEINSWKNSMMYMNNVLIDNSIPSDAMVSIEFQIPLTSKRIDFIIAGKDEDKKDNAIIIELKQWQKAEMTEKDAIVKTRFQYGEVETAHPSYQAWTYVALLYGFNQTVQDEQILLKPCAYLHNYTSDNQIDNDFYGEYINKAPLFLRTDRERLSDFIKRYIKYGDDSNILYRIDHGKIKPSKQLADSLSSMLKGNEEFYMIDDQKVVYETAIALAKNSSAINKNVLIVEGGPGTGKSVVAINLLVNFTNSELSCQYVTKNAAPRAVYASKLTGTMKKTEISNLFKSSGGYFNSEANEIDVLIVDEAHRLNLKSGLFANLGENQILEIINASKFAIFFVDDNQQIHIRDVGERRKIQIDAEFAGAKVTMLHLQSQFRCNGSDGYLGWLDNLLGIRETANETFDSREYDFQVFDDPNELRHTIEEKNQINNKSRMVAGYCWDWISKKDPTKKDVVIEEFDFAMTWNLTKDGSNWIIAENSINEIGCIHTCQGLELDYIGVIIGNDLRFEDGQIATDVTKRSKMDQSVRGIKKMMKEDRKQALEISDRIIRNTYRTLMTRGMKGCFVFCCDEPLAEIFRSRMKKFESYDLPPSRARIAAENQEDYGDT